MSIHTRAIASIAASPQASAIYSLHREMLADATAAMEARDVVLARRLLSEAKPLQLAANALVDAAKALLED